MSKLLHTDVLLLDEQIERARNALIRLFPERASMYNKADCCVIIEYMFLRALLCLEIEQEKREAA